MDECNDAFSRRDKKLILESTIAFIKKYSTSFNLDEPLSKKKRFVDSIFDQLSDPSDVSESENFYIYLQALRIMTRNKADLDELFTEDKVNNMLHLARLVGKEEAFMTENSKDFDTKVVVEAQKCICNLLFNSTRIQSYCCKNSCIDGIMLRLKMYKDPKLPVEVKYFDMRMLFILTGLCEHLRGKIYEEYHGFIYLMEVIDLILKETQEPDQRPSKKSQRKRKSKNMPDDQKDKNKQVKDNELDDLSVDLCCEVLKVLFNLSHWIQKNNLDDGEEAHFIRLVGILHDLLLTDTKSKEKRYNLLNHTVNLFNNIPSKCFEELLVPIPEIGILDNPKYEYEDKNVEAIAVLVEFLEKKLDIKYDKQVTLYENLSPILSCMCEMAKAHSIIRKYLRLQILPPLKDVMQRPEEGTTLRNKLVKLMTSPNTSIKDLVAEFLFILCKENVGRLIKYTGFGNSSGLIANRGLLAAGRSQGNYSSDSDDSDTEEYLSMVDKINPVTGCYEESRSNVMETLTEEQKEHEAMELVNLIDKLNALGVVQPCRLDESGRPQPIKHILEMRKEEEEANNKESDSD